MSQKTSVFNLEQLMDYLGSETFVGVTSAGYEPYKDQSGELRDTERFLLLDDKGFVWSLWVYETEEGFGAEAAYSQSDLAQYGLFFPEGETLEVQIYREPCWLLEAAELVYGLVNRIPAGKLTVPGQYCIPPDELRKIQEEACAGLDLEDELLRLYFRGTALEGVSGRKFCLGCALLYVSFDLAHPEPEEMTRCLKETWYKLRREQYRISGINMFSLGLERAKEPSFQTLAEEIGDLPVPVKLRMQILEVFSAYDVHLDRVVALLRPVAEALPALLRPWVERAAPLVKQWEEFFAAHTPQEFLYRRARVQVEDCQFLDMTFRYVTPNLSPAIILKDEHGWHIHMGIAVKPDLTPVAKAQEWEEWELTAMHLLSSPARMEMLHAMTDRYMSAQELAQALNLNSGTVFRDLNSMYDARLLYIENRNGRNCYRTNYGMVQQVTEHIQRYLSGKE